MATRHGPDDTEGGNRNEEEIMKYENIVGGMFIDRPNRFVAHVEIGGKTETVHVKNTGRCRELLLPGAEVFLNRSDNPKRKTAYDLVAVTKQGLGLVNIDSQAPNHVAAEWLDTLGFDEIRPEHTWGDSRIDFYMRRGGEEYLMEVKGCTLERNGQGYFPDAPTARGVKHLHELTKAAGTGIRASICFVIAMPGVTGVLPNRETDPAFGDALTEAEKAGVSVFYVPCIVSPAELSPDFRQAARLNRQALEGWSVY